MCKYFCTREAWFPSWPRPADEQPAQYEQVGYDELKDSSVDPTLAA
jgi:hypothetical protein